jgi:Flp pilus assembly protein CpaB
MLRIAAVIVVIVTAGLVASGLAALHRRAQDFGAPRPAVVARRDLPVGTTIRRDDVRVRTIHSSQLPPGVLDAEAAAVGRVVTVAMLRDGFVTRRNVAGRRRTGLDGALPPGSRALRIVVTEAVRPRVGASVDVLASFEDTETATVIAAGVLVLGSESATSSDGAPARGVTLLVSPRQARDLVFATTHGFVTISLVPPEEARRSG